MISDSLTFSLGLVTAFLFHVVFKRDEDEETSPIYLDYNATTPISKSCGDAMIPFIREHWGNPSSKHKFGQSAKKGVDKARAQIAQFLGSEVSEIVLMSGGTETINYALKGGAFKQREKNLGNHIITSKIEHIAVTETCQWLESQGFEITYLDVDKYGQISVELLEKEMKKTTIIVSLMHANNEVGTINPIADLVKAAKNISPDVLFHTDCSQSAGKIITKVNELGVDLATIAGHKLYGPKGVGALFKRKGVELEKFMHGAGHEHGQRAGTENVILYAGLGQACEDLENKKSFIVQELKEKRDYLFTLIKKQLGTKNKDKYRVNGHPVEKLPNTLSLSFKDINATELLDNVSHILAASAGAACHSDCVTLSHVLAAMKVDPVFGMGTVRLSVGTYTNEKDLERASKALTQEVLRFWGTEL